MADDDLAISVRNLSKTYRIFGHPGDRLKQAMSLGLRRYHREFTALKDVSFDIRKGETVGIIGRNGSGKSTLLQVICGILKPTSGTVQVNGRVSALLELGAGFNPEFTGRENVYFQGALMGLKRVEMEKRLDSIIDFADIGEYIDQPVRTYSSGMFVRLAFAAAIHVDPDLLFVDEALAVGDSAFQRKCYAQVDQLRDAGCTVVFVSHDMSAIMAHSDQVMLFSKGELAMMGAAKPLIDSYLAGISTSNIDCGTGILCSEQHDPQRKPLSTIYYARRGAEIVEPRLLTTHGEPTNLLRRGYEYDYVYDVRFDVAATNIRFGMLIRTPDGFELGGLASAPPGAGVQVTPGMWRRQAFRFRCNLLPGTYFLNAGVVGPDGDYLHRILDAVMFTVLPESDLLGSGYIDLAPIAGSV